MATNLPVIATRFGALPRVFNEGAGFYYADNKEEIKKAIDQIRNGAIIQTRDMVMGFAWEELIQQLIRIYEDLTN
jgi:glycosyltransferase involved in cell wall biosynthesis